jgi:Gly-Xaa carboxypeptidase
MLTGHIDVVPRYSLSRYVPSCDHSYILFFSLTALDRWSYPPFSGTIDEEWIYGRGAGDCKNNVIGIMTAVEHLIKSNWTPTRTISKRCREP